MRREGDVRENRHRESITKRDTKRRGRRAFGDCGVPSLCDIVEVLVRGVTRRVKKRRRPFGRAALRWRV